MLILDNFEHVTEAASNIHELLISCPRLKILITSRIILRLYGELEYDVQRYAAVHLFLQRAQAAKATLT